MPISSGDMRRACFFGIQKGADSGILGINFLQSAYVVFDQTLNTISPAQYANCGQNEQGISSSGAGSFVGECAVANVTTMPSLEQGGAGLSPGAKAGIGIGVSAAVLIALRASILSMPTPKEQEFFRPRKRSRHHRQLYMSELPLQPT